MRAPIISDTTRTVTVVRNPFGDEPEVAGYFVAEHCPVNGPSILPFPGRETREEAQADIDAYLNS